MIKSSGSASYSELKSKPLDDVESGENGLGGNTMPSAHGPRGASSQAVHPSANGESRASWPICEAIKGFMTSSPLNVMLLILPLAIGARHIGWEDEVIFSLNFLAILPLAGLLGNATEELSASVGETMGGLLNATFGNAVEMILSLFALRQGLVDVVQSSLLGSILSNLLLVLGFCFLLGGLRFHTQKYNANGARVQSSLLLLSVLALIMPALAGNTARGKHLELFMSRGAALILAFLYLFYLVFQLRTHPEHFQANEEEESEEAMPAWLATVLLLILTLLVAVCSECLVGSVEGLSSRMNIPRSFIGGILLPIVGNAAEHATAVSVAMKDKLDLSLGVALGSSSQIALLVVPFTVLAGWVIGVPMDLDFSPMNTGILLLTVLIVSSLTNDGESNWLEGAMLLAAYLLVGVTFWFIG